RATPIVAGKGSTSLAGAALSFPEYAPAISPDGRSVAWNQQYGDSTTIDIWIRTPAGARRLTRHNRDDLVTGWLADGSAIVGLTSRWSPPKIGNYKVAVFDTATGAARQITRGPGHDGMPLVSPDGTRIAFVHETDDSPISLCVTAIDGRDVPECRLLGGYPVQILLGWRGPNELVATIEIAGAHPLVRYDWQRKQLTTLFDSDVRTALMSPDRRWIAATATVKGIRGLREWIIPVDEPTHARLIKWQTAAASRARWWEGPADWAQMVDRIEFADAIRTVLPGIGTRLRIRAFSSAQVERPVVAVVRWKSSDTLVAIVDSTGNVQPLKSGSVTIEASLAGWRKVRRRIDVRAGTATTLLDERWDDRWQTRWITFGDPQPAVVNGPGNVPAFWNRGDGTYQSIGIFRRALSGKEGLGVEVRLSTRVNETGAQRLRVVLVAGLDTLAFKSADQRNASPSPAIPDAICGAQYPSVPGQFGRSNLGVMGGTSQQIDLGPVAEKLGSGEWWTLRIQILPDGRCGVAVNDHVVWLSPEPISLDGDFYLRLGDAAAGAKLLHGPLQVWSGVRTDVKWSR
ncbi:MAG: Ig-like domain-containing protein, partial [Gemmatimonadales bacterium]